jgi:hypothetical protein
LKAYDEQWLSCLFEFDAFHITMPEDAEDTSSEDGPLEEEEDAEPLWVFSSFDDIFDRVKDHQLHLEALLMEKSSSILVFSREIVATQARLRGIHHTLQLLETVQAWWQELLPIFGNLHVKSKIYDRVVTEALGSESILFHEADRTFREFVDVLRRDPLVVRGCSKPGRTQLLQNLESDLQVCAKGAERWLDQCRQDFPRFFFMSPADIANVIAACCQAQNLNRHITSIHANIAHLDLARHAHVDWLIRGFVARNSEIVDFPEPIHMTGAYVVPSLTQWFRHVCTLRATLTFSTHTVQVC